MTPEEAPILTERWMNGVDRELSDIRKEIRANRELEVSEHSAIKDEIGGMVIKGAGSVIVSVIAAAVIQRLTGG